LEEGVFNTIRLVLPVLWVLIEKMLSGGQPEPDILVFGMFVF